MPEARKKLRNGQKNQRFCGFAGDVIELDDLRRKAIDLFVTLREY